MSYLPYACIPVVALLYLGTLVVTVRMGGQLLRRYFRAAKRFCREQGLSIADDPVRPERFVITGALDGVPLRVSTDRVELDDTHGEARYRPVQRVELERAGRPGWVLHPPLQVQSHERIVAPRVPDVGPRIATGDDGFDRKLWLFSAQGQLPAFARIGWLRSVLLQCHLELGVSHEGRTVVDFHERELRDAPFDLHLLRRRILAALALADPGCAERHRDLLVEPPPAPLDWSRVPLIAMFLSLAPAVAGSIALDFPQGWMGAVVGAAAGYPVALLVALLATGLWIRRARRR